MSIGLVGLTATVVSLCAPDLFDTLTLSRFLPSMLSGLPTPCVPRLAPLRVGRVDPCVPAEADVVIIDVTATTDTAAVTSSRTAELRFLIASPFPHGTVASTGSRPKRRPVGIQWQGSNEGRHA